MQMKMQHGWLASIHDAQRGSLSWQSAQCRFSGRREIAAISAERDILVLVAVLVTLAFAALVAFDGDEDDVALAEALALNLPISSTPLTAELKEKPEWLVPVSSRDP